MKRLAAVLVAALATVPLIAQLLIPSDAGAGCKWVTKEIRWLRTYISGTTTFPHDTAYASVGGAADTTGWFTLEGLCPGVANSRFDLPETDGDSAVVAIVTVVSDTTATYTPNTTAVSFVVEMGSHGDQLVNGNFRGHQAVIQASAAHTIATGDDNAAFPIWLKVDVANVNLGYGVLSGQPMRLRFTGSTGANALAMCRVFVSYPADLSP